MSYVIHRIYSWKRGALACVLYLFTGGKGLPMVMVTSAVFVRDPQFQAVSRFAVMNSSALLFLLLGKKRWSVDVCIPFLNPGSHFS